MVSCTWHEALSNFSLNVNQLCDLILTMFSMADNEYIGRKYVMNFDLTPIPYKTNLGIQSWYNLASSKFPVEIADKSDNLSGLQFPFW